MVGKENLISQTMNYQNSFIAMGQTKNLRREKFLQEMAKVIPWGRLLTKILPHYESNELGRKRKDALLMLKIYFLQQWYSLSDPAMEEEIYDRNTFQKFLDLDLLVDTVPDETTILNFRHLLEKYALQKKFFAIVNQMLEEKGLIMKEGTIVDATIIAAPKSTKNLTGKRDPEMGSTKKGNNWYFGMKGHIGVSAENGLVHSVEGTSANIHDKAMFEQLLHGEEKAVFGDKGYVDKELKQEARKDGIYWGVLDRAVRGHALSGSQKKKNRKMSSVRSKVEHPFQVLKCQWYYRKVRYKGLKKNLLQLFSLFALCNIYRMRKKLLTT